MHGIMRLMKEWKIRPRSVLKTTPNNEIPGNDGLSKESYEIFWDDIKYFNDFIKTSQIRR